MIVDDVVHYWLMHCGKHGREEAGEGWRHFSARLCVAVDSHRPRQPHAHHVTRPLCTYEHCRMQFRNRQSRF
jgi:hypothetical protein